MSRLSKTTRTVSLMKRPANYKTKNPAIKKFAFYCTDGPLLGYTLFLTDGVSIVFSMAGQTGRYNLGKWENI